MRKAARPSQPDPAPATKAARTPRARAVAKAAGSDQPQGPGVREFLAFCRIEAGLAKAGKAAGGKKA